MSITEQDIPFVERAPVDFLPEQEDLHWFSPSVLECLHPHPLDRTIQYTTKRSFFVRWFEAHSEQRHDESTVSVTSLVEHVRIPASDRTPLETKVDDDRREMGIYVHRWMECVLNGLPFQCTTALHRQIADYYTTHLRGSLIPWRTEMAIRSSSDLRIVGVIDALFIQHTAVCSTAAPTPIPGDGTLGLHLKDWKYSRDVSSCLADYTQQLNMYRFILESQYSGPEFWVDGASFTRLSVVSMEVVVFHESRDSYTVYPIPDCQDRIRAQMETRKHSLEIKESHHSK